MTWTIPLAASLLVAQQTAGPELTVYNGGFALVKEQRTINLREGRQEVTIENVAALIEPTSVGIQSNKPGSFTVLEQNYRYDLISTQAILNKAVGGKIILNRVLPNGVKERIVGTLMSSPTAIVNSGDGAYNTYNGMVVRTDDGRILLNPTGEVEVLSIPEGMISKPSLVWDLMAATSGPNEIELSYLTQGMSWTASYVLILAEGDKTADVKGWVTMNNQSGIAYKDARLKLLAGTVNRVRGGGPAPGGRGGAALEMKTADAGFLEETFAEYHLYTLQRPATVNNKETKQLSLMEAFRVPVTKRLVVDSMRSYGRYQPGEGEVGTGPISPLFQLQFVNNKDSNMGMPLPEGTVKVFANDKSGSIQLIGEDSIRHTPRDERVTLDLGRSFDVVAERKRTAFAWIYRSGSIRGARETFEIEVRNRKDAETVVDVIERHYWQWAITQANEQYTRLDSDTVLFKLTLAPNTVKKVIYTVETTW